tara:strand:- start:213 stop:695 length:483 start_codon:yes stop_codon:yes gene_type:complete
MNEKDKLQLQKMIKANDCEDQTDKIRDLKHSDLIKIDVSKLAKIAFSYKDLRNSNPEKYNEMCIKEANFLFNNYTDIFNKVKSEEINLSILGKFLEILKQIENEEVDQHEASYAVGVLLKEMYIDSAMRKAEHLDQKNGVPEIKKPTVNISWSTYKKMQN